MSWMGLAEREGAVSNSTRVPKGPGARRPGTSAAHAERLQAREPKVAETRGFEPLIPL
jgi:hypothetical protein